MITKYKTSLVILVTILVGWTAQAQQRHLGEMFVASGIEALDGSGTSDSLINSVIADANDQCSPFEAEQVSDWKFKYIKAGYLWMTKATATFICVDKHF